MESAKDSSNELTTKIEHAVPAVSLETSDLIYQDALRKALMLRGKPSDPFFTDQSSPAESSTLRDYLHILFSHKTLIISTFAAVLIGAWVGLQLQTPMYEAQVKMLISGEKQVESSYYREINGYRNVPIALTQSAIVTSQPVIEKAAQALGLYEQTQTDEEIYASPLKKKWMAWRDRGLNQTLELMPSDAHQNFLNRRAEENLRSSIKVEPIRDTQLFTIRVKAFTPKEAMRRANVISRAYVIFDMEQQMAELALKYGDKHPAIIELKDSIDQMSANLNGALISSIEAIGPASVKIIEQAKTPLSAAGVSKNLVLLSAAAIGVLLALILAFSFDALDQTIKTPQDIENFLNMPFLGSITKKGLNEKVLIHGAQHSTPYLRSYQHLCDQIYLVMKNKNLKMLLLASATPELNSTPIIANLGTYFAQKTNQKVLLVDADLRSPQLRKFFNLPDLLGLADVLEGKVSFENATHHLGHNLSLLAAGSSVHNPITLLDSPAMVEFIKTARERYDMVLFDCANLKHFRDAYFLSAYLDGVALVLEERNTRRHAAKKILSPWEDSNANIIGAILNNRTFPIPDVIYARV